MLYVNIHVFTDSKKDTIMEPNMPIYIYIFVIVEKQYSEY